MRNLFFYLFISLSVIATAQTKQEKEVENFFWGSGDKHKNAVDVPKKWLNESAVILYKNINYEYVKKGKKVTYKTSIRQRIKLLDKNSVEEFSKFSYIAYSQKGAYGTLFYQKEHLNQLGIRIVKPSGEIKIIDVEKNSVNVDGETKVAIPDLEIGDIIDYYFHEKEPYLMGFTYDFEPVERTLSGEYPIVDYKLFFEVQNDDFYINFNSFNGAPKLKKVASPKKKIRRYVLEGHDLEKNDFPMWYFPLVELPAYKFQVHYIQAKKYRKNIYAFVGEDDKVIKRTVSSQDVLNSYKRKFKPDGNISDVKGWFRDQSFKNDREKVITGYYYMRHYYLTRFMEAAYLDKEFNSNSLLYAYDEKSVFIKNQKQFMNHFTEFLNENDIKFDIIIAKSRFDGSIDDFLLESNANVLIKVKTTDPIYVKLFGLHTSINEYPALIEGTEAYLLSTSEDRLKRIVINNIKKEVLPGSTFNDNVLFDEFQIDLNEDFTGFSLNIDHSYTGFFKNAQQYDKMIFSDYVMEDYQKFGTEKLIDKIKRKKRKKKMEGQLVELKEKLKKEQKETLKNDICSDLDIDHETVQNYDYQITQTGRYGLDSPFSYTESFDFKDVFIKKAGPNYIIEFGKFIGGQIDLDEEQHNRKDAVYLNYPRSIKYSIHFTIPDGYSVSGLDKLNKSVINDFGSFVSVAKIEGNTLIVNTTKQYKKNYIPASNWSDMTDFLDAAWQFTNEKIMLKKG